MSKDTSSEHYLLVRPDLKEPSVLDYHYLTLHTLATSAEGEDLRSIIIEVNGIYEKSAEPYENIRKIYISGQIVTGQSVVCELTYDDSDHTQMLTIENVE